MKQKLTAMAGAVALAIALSGVAQAVPFVEGEANGAVGTNETLGTASDLTALSGTINVAGTIRNSGNGSDDIDFYKIFVTAATNLVLSISGPTTGSVSSGGGTMDVALFSASSVLLAYDNNSGNPSDPAAIDFFTITTTGFYYVSVAEWSETPTAISSGSPIYTALANAGFAISGVGADATWADTGGQQHPGESYALTITGAAAVPAPATAVLLGLGLAALGLWRNRRS